MNGGSVNSGRKRSRRVEDQVMGKNYGRDKGRHKRARTTSRVEEKRLSLSSICSRAREHDSADWKERERKKGRREKGEGRGREEARGRVGMNDEESEKRVEEERRRIIVCSSILSPSCAHTRTRARESEGKRVSSSSLKCMDMHLMERRKRGAWKRRRGLVPYVCMSAKRGSWTKGVLDYEIDKPFEF